VQRKNSRNISPDFPKAPTLHDEVIFLNLPNPSGRTRPSNRNDYHKHKNNNVSGEKSAVGA
jgi:hypothetical protein